MPDHHTTDDHVTDPHGHRQGTFAEGQADPARYAEDGRLGRFSDGQARPAADLMAGRFGDRPRGRRAADMATYLTALLSDGEVAA